MQRSLIVVLALAVAACGTTTGGTSGASGTGGVSSTSGGAATGGSSGGGTTGGSSTGGTSSGTTTGSTPPYQGFDAGPHPEPPIDKGCYASTPYMSDAGFCVTCRWDADCPPNWFCGLADVDVPFICYQCRPDPDAGTVGCAPGEVCESPTFLPRCAPDCRTAAVDCTPGYCDPDAGVCIKRGCRNDADCRGLSAEGDAGGFCIYAGTSSSYCVGCLPDGGGCPPGELCNALEICEPNCLDGGPRCAVGSYCSSKGLCTLGCQVDTDCGGADPYCQLTLDPPGCAPCLRSSDCPSWRPRCETQPGCTFCTNQCGQCASASDCASGHQCSTEGCGCGSDADCAAFPTQPLCIGLFDGGTYPGTCACRTTADCASGFVCETRSPYQVHRFDGINDAWGGACIPSCVGADAGYCAAAVGKGQTNIFALDNITCNPSTGYCVSCVQDSDCSTSSSQPIAAPSCIPFPNGNFTTNDGSPPLATGGGQCGCASTASCDDGFACYAPSSPGTCEAPCTFVDGLDSCVHRFLFEGETLPGPYCNTFTGACEECLDDYDCSGSICAPGGKCVQCIQASQCPADRPGCFQGQCGLCGADSDCPPGEGLTCAPYYSGGVLRCVAPCVPGDDAGMGSVSDAGPSCPSSQPFCTVSGTSAPGEGWCSECRYGSADCVYLCCGTYCSSNYNGCVR
jgi:hypothetical protein